MRYTTLILELMTNVPDRRQSVGRGLISISNFKLQISNFNSISTPIHR